jgi:DNA processing protein
MPDRPGDDEVAASVALGLLPGVGPRTVRRWIDAAGSAAAAWRGLTALAAGRRDRDAILAARATLDGAAVVARARAQGLSVIAWADARYPALLRAITDPPPALFVRGALDDGPAVAIVGARAATAYGLAAAERLGFDLAAAGVTVVSGLARGVDGAAHRGALAAGGRTVAVLGSGPDVIYPREHRRLAAEVSARGALVSEFAPGTPPRSEQFPRRNRIISGLALGVLVVEGAEDSGALVTVDYALDQGRDVFAVPGSIFSAMSRAPHALLRQGARIVEGAADVLAELGLAAVPALPAAPDAAAAAAGSGRPAGAPGGGEHASGGVRSADEGRLLAALAGGPLALDDLVEALGLPASRVAALVGWLEVHGLVRVLPGQMLMRTPGRPVGP